jgi:hypothetical protein
MPEELTPERLAVCEKFAEDLQTELWELGRSVREDLEIIIRFSSPSIVAQARQYAAGRGSQSPRADIPADDATFCEACQKFAEKYASLKGC